MKNSLKVNEEDLFNTFKIDDNMMDSYISILFSIQSTAYVLTGHNIICSIDGNRLQGSEMQLWLED